MSKTFICRVNHGGSEKYEGKNTGSAALNATLPG